MLSSGVPATFLHTDVITFFNAFIRTIPCFSSKFINTFYFKFRSHIPVHIEFLAVIAQLEEDEIPYYKVCSFNISQSLFYIYHVSALRLQ